MTDFIRGLYAETVRSKGQQQQQTPSPPQPSETPAVPVESLTAGGKPSDYTPPTADELFREMLDG